MKIRHFAVASCIVLALALGSCASAPKPESPAPAQPAPAAAPAAQPAAPEVSGAPLPTDLRAKATELRKRAFDLGLREVVASDYDDAESSYLKGSDTYGKDNATSAAAYQAAIDKFGAVIDKGLPLLAASWHQKAASLRDTALAKGSDKLYPSLMPGAQSSFDKAAADETARSYESAVGGFKNAASLFEVLYKLADAKAVRDSIQQQDFAKWDPSNWTLAEGKYAASQQLFAADVGSSRGAVDEALLRYRLVLTTAYGYYAADRRTASEAAMQRAQGIKSQVAVQADFDAAMALYDQAKAKSAAKDDQAAGPLYAQAAIAFDAAYTKAKGKMDHAQSEIDSLDAALKTAEATN